jgi:hypothetical protein
MPGMADVGCQPKQIAAVKQVFAHMKENLRTFLQVIENS